jgi:hypothetical protein
MSAGDGKSVDASYLADLLRDAERHDGAFEASAPKHSWADWYAPYIRARLVGNTSDEAVESADHYMKDSSMSFGGERHPVFVGRDGSRAAATEAVHL